MWARWRLRKICRAIGVRPYQDVKDYVLEKKVKVLVGGRRSGKTTALILDALVYKRVPPEIERCGMDCIFCMDRDYNGTELRKMHYAQMLKRAVEMCEEEGIDVGRGWKRGRN